MAQEILKEEQMNFEELDAVNGGTNKECKELKNALPRIDGFFGKRKMSEREVISWLDKNLGIKATLHDGFFLDPGDDAGDSNLYKLKSTGKYISHEETMDMIKKFLGK